MLFQRMIDDGEADLSLKRLGLQLNFLGNLISKFRQLKMSLRPESLFSQPAVATPTPILLYPPLEPLNVYN